MKPYYSTANGTLYHGDCYELVAELKAAHPDINLLLTDPPYQIGRLTGKNGARKFFRRNKPGNFAYMTKIDNNNLGVGFDSAILNEFENWFCFCAKQQLVELIQLASVRNWQLINWIKLNPVPLMGPSYLPDTEYIIHSFSKKRLFGGYEDRKRHIQTHIGGENKRTIHPNLKPFAVIQKLVTLGSREGELIADLFMGSGTTAVVCEKMNRRWVGVEKEEKFCELAVERIEKEITQLKLWEN